MIDFTLSDDGDIVLGHKKELPALRLGFHASAYPVFRLSFNQKMEYQREEHEGFHIQFMTYNHNIQSPAIAKTVINEEEIRQRIRILLRTEYGELRNESTFGSHLYQQKHNNLIAADTIASVQNIVQQEVMNALDTTEEHVRVVANPEKVDGPFYCQNMMIYVFQNEELIYQFPLE